MCMEMSHVVHRTIHFKGDTWEAPVCIQIIITTLLRTIRVQMSVTVNLDKLSAGSGACQIIGEKSCRHAA